MTVVKSPRRMPSAASPMLWVPVEHAVTMHRAAGAHLDGDLARRGVREHVGDEERADRPGPGLHRLDGICHQTRATDARAEHHPDLLAVVRADLETGIGDRLLAAATPKTTFLSVRRTALIHPRVRIEVTHLARRAALHGVGMQ